MFNKQRTPSQYGMYIIRLNQRETYYYTVHCLYVDKGNKVELIV